MHYGLINFIRLDRLLELSPHINRVGKMNYPQYAPGGASDVGELFRVTFRG